MVRQCVSGTIHVAFYGFSLLRVALIDGDAQLGVVDGIEIGEILDANAIAPIALSSEVASIQFDFCEHQLVSLSGYVYQRTKYFS